MWIKDNLLNAKAQTQVYDFVSKPGWEYDWKSKRKTDLFSFWHKHYAGHRKTGTDKPYDCAEELKQKAPLMFAFWTFLSKSHLKGHRVIRCYANGTPYGTDGTVHWDDKDPRSFTSVYYPHSEWSPNWGGETVFFNKEETEIIRSVYPKPNRFVAFQGMIPHVARGVSRICPVMRITLMFKTDIKSDGS